MSVARYSIALAAASAMSLYATDLQAAERSTLGCIGIAIGPEAMQAIGEAALRRNDGLQAQPVETELQSMAEAADDCRRRNGWSEDAATAAAMWTLASARIDAAAAALGRDGVDPGKVGEAMGRLTPAELEGLSRDPISRASVAALGDHARAMGIPTAGIVSHHIVWFAAMLAREEPQRLRFESS